MKLYNLFVLILFVFYFQNCDITISDRVAQEDVCPRVFYQSLLHWSLIDYTQKNMIESPTIPHVNSILLAYSSYENCMRHHPFGGTILTPLDDLLWNGCGRCYK